MSAPRLAASTAIRLPSLLGPELARALEKEITELRLAPDTKLIEEDVCSRFGVSRSPVREALQILASHGLVERHPRRGMFVPALSVERLDEIYACRKPLEGLAAAGVAQNAAPALLRRLRELVEVMSRADRDDRRDDAFSANVALTDLLHEHCGNETLKRLLLGLDRQALRYRFYCYHESREIIAASIKGNRALLEAISAKAADEASAITEELVSRSWLLIRSTLVKGIQDGNTQSERKAKETRE